MKAHPNGYLPSGGEGERKAINSELWHACAGPLVSLPPVGSLVVYFPQGHSEQVAASMQKEADVIPSYPNLPSKLVCILHDVTLHADLETDEVYAQMTLQPVSKFDKEAILASEIGIKQSRQPAEFFCKTLTASDTSTHGGFSVPRRAAEKIFPPLDFSMQPPAQELTARDLHDSSWTFRHIYRGQPKRHLLTTGWSVFVSTKRLFTGDSVLFIRDEKSQLMLGVRRANRQQPALSSSVISSDSIHIGVLAAAAQAAANNSPFVIFFNPRASPAEFVIPFSKYNKAMYTQVSLGMRFRMMFETEESGVRRYMGTVTGISDLDSVRWKNSQWRNLQVGWDESTAGERPSRVSIWDIEPIVTPFYICPPPFFRPKFPRQPGMPDEESDMENVFKRAMPWLGDEFGMKDPSSAFPGLSLAQWMSMQQNNQFPSAQSGFFPSMVPPCGMHNTLSTDDPTKLLNFQAPSMSPQAIQFNKANPSNQIGQLTQSPLARNQQQKQLQQLSQNPMSQVQQQQQQQLPLVQQLPNQQQQQQQQRVPQPSPQQQPLAEAQQTRQPTSHLQQQTQMFQAPPLNNGLVAPNHIQNQTLQQQAGFPQLQQQQQIANSNIQVQSTASAIKTPYQMTSLAHDPPFQHQMEPKPNILPRQQQQQQQPPSAIQLLQQNLSQRSQPQAPAVSQMQQLSQASLSDQQLQLVQKLQQHQQQQHLLPGSLLMQPQLSSQPYSVHQNQQFQHSTLLQNHQQPLGGSGITMAALAQPQLFTASQIHALQKLPTAVRAHSTLTDGETPSCSTSPSTNNCQISPHNFLNRSQQGPTILMGESPVEPTRNANQNIHGKSDIRIKHEFASSKEVEQSKYKGSIMDPLEASSSGTSYCLDAGTIQQNFSLPTFGLDGDVHSRSSLPFASNVDGMAPDALLSRAYDSQRDLQNLLANYSCAPRDIETELSAAAISSQSFGMPNLPFKPSCSNDVAVNEPGVLSGGGGLWGNQTQRMRTYTKIQKCGSVGRSIDVTRYKCYDELRHDLARMFGIEGQLEDPQSSDWKLVYLDHENDILLVGDDPWEEFVSCVQSIKILSSGEVKQMSLDGDLGDVPVSHQACSGTDSGNAWRTHYDDHSAASFNR